MIIKNTDDSTVTLRLETRDLVLQPGGQIPISAGEVMDAVLREHLQRRAISIVGPITEEEELAVQKLLEKCAAGKG